MKNAVLNGMITRKRASEMLSITAGTLRRWERRGIIKAYKLNSRVTRYKLSDIEKVLH